jgi:hypothetical protein
MEFRTRLDRDLQKKILQMLADIYPEKINLDKALRGLESEDTYLPMDAEAEWKIASNIAYLAAHDLIDGKVNDLHNGFTFGFAKITHKGLDFIADDGGLSAIFNVTTVRFEAAQLREMLESKINHAELPASDKLKILQTLRSMPAEGIKILTMKLLEQGLASLPDAARAIHSLIRLLF